MIVAGEASGDAHGAGVVRALRQRLPDAVFFGIGGRQMRAEGVEILAEADSLSVVGITEVFAKLPALSHGRARARNAIRIRRPDLLICIDFPDFNLHLAAFAKANGVPVLYYISPQIWAWRRGRVKKIGRRVDHVAVILPFEATFYKQHGIAASFVGHPLLEHYPEPVSPPAAGRDGASPTVGLLPGSRDREVMALMPVMLDAARRIRQRLPGTRFLLSRAPNVDALLFDRVLHGQDGPLPELTISDGPVRDVFDNCHMLVAASGTVTLEAAIAGVPMVIIYKVSPVSYWMGRALIRVNHIGLANLIAGRTIVPELIQDQVTPEAVAGAASGLLEHPEDLERMRAALLQVRHQLGRSGASGRVADIALGLMH